MAMESSIEKAKTIFNKVRNRLYKAALSNKEPLQNKPNQDASVKGPVVPEPKDLPKDPGSVFFDSFIKTFLWLLIPALIFFICTLGGSIAANDAIGRHWAVRIVYFFYGSFPLFSPLVLIYYIYRYFIDTYPVWYNFLPLTTTVYDNSFMRFITKPFYYSDDANIQYMHKKFIDSAQPFIMGSTNSGSKESKQSNGSSSNSISSSRNGNSASSSSNPNGSSSNGIGPTGTNSNSGNGSSNTKGTTGSSGSNSSNTGTTGIGKTDLSGVTGTTISAPSSPKVGPTGF
jgi:hypothetical protein